MLLAVMAYFRVLRRRRYDFLGAKAKLAPMSARNRALLPNAIALLALMLALFIDMLPVGREPMLPSVLAVVLVFWNVHQRN
jgi:hypothetical protein